MESVFRQTGKMPKELAEQPPLPKEFEHLWEWFLEARTGMSGQWSWQGLEAWSRLNRIGLTAEETRLLSKLNSILIDSHGGRHHKSGS